MMETKRSNRISINLFRPSQDKGKGQQIYVSPRTWEELGNTAEQGDKWIEVEEKEPGAFMVIGDNLTDGDYCKLGLQWWDNTVENLDIGKNESEAFMGFGISLHLRWKDVEFTVNRQYELTIRAPSIELLQEAFTHIKICAWNPDDI